MRRSVAAKTSKGEDEDKRVTSQQKLKTRRFSTRSTDVPSQSKRVDGGKRIPLAQKTTKSSQLKKLSSTTPPPRKATPISSRRPVSPKPLCQRSQRRHEQFRASFEKMTIGGSRDKGSLPPKKTTHPRPRPTPKAGGSMPPILPSVRTSSQTPSATPSATPRRPRRRWFPESTPEIEYRPRSVREAAAQEKLHAQLGSHSLNLSPSIGATPRSALGFSPLSPQVPHSADPSPKERSIYRTKSDSMFGQTPPPAEADADSERLLLEDDGWGARRRYGNEDNRRANDKQHFRLKSQQLQYNRISQFKVERPELSATPMAIYERVEEEDLDLA